MLSCFSRVSLFATPWTVACHTPLSMEFSRQEYWNGKPFPSSGDLPDPGIEPGSKFAKIQSDYHYFSLICLDKNSNYTFFFQPFCKLTGYSHEIYVDPEREIYKRLGMKRGEEIASSGKTCLKQEILIVYFTFHISIYMHRGTNGKFINQPALYDSNKWSRFMIL